MSEIDYFLDVHLDFTVSMKKKLGYFPLCPEFKKGNEEFFTGLMEKDMSHKYRPVNKLTSDWIDRISIYTQYGEQIFYVELSMKKMYIRI